MMVGMTDGAGISKNSVTGTWALAVDFDRGADKQVWDDSPIKPTFVVRTSTDRYHFVWVLTEPIDTTQAGQFLLAMAHRFNGDLAFANVAQAVRLPGFVNGKYATEVNLAVSPDDARAYSPTLLRDGCDVTLITDFLRSAQPRFDGSLNLAKGSVTEEHLLEDLRSALSHIPPDEYDVWFKVLVALHSVGEKGRRLAHDWSATCTDKYDRQTLDDKWAGLDRCSIGATVRSIFAMAADNGWHNPGSAAKLSTQPRPSTRSRSALSGAEPPTP